VGCYREAGVDIARGWQPGVCTEANLENATCAIQSNERANDLPKTHATTFYVDHVSQFLTTRTVSAIPRFVWQSHTPSSVDLQAKTTRGASDTLRLVISPQLVNSVLSKLTLR
jgi:hypothetical protein